jgi:hypothetical protein
MATMTDLIDAQLAKIRDEMVAAVNASTAENRTDALVDLLVLLRGVVLTNQEPGPAHAAARDVAESAVAAALTWLKD